MVEEMNYELEYEIINGDYMSDEEVIQSPEELLAELQTSVNRLALVLSEKEKALNTTQIEAMNLRIRVKTLEDGLNTISIGEYQCTPYDMCGAMKLATQALAAKEPQE